MGRGDDVAGSLATAMVWTALEKYAYRILSLVTFALLAHLLRVRDFGTVAIGMTIVELLRTFVDQGLSQVLIVDEDDDGAGTALLLGIVFGCGLCAVMFAAAPAIAFAFHEPPATNVIRALSAVFLLQGVTVVPEALLQKQLKFRLLAIRRITAASLSSVAALAAAFLGLGVWALVIQVLALYGVGAIILWMTASFRPDLRVRRTRLARQTKFGIQVIGVDLSSYLANNGDNLVVGLAMGPQALGLYTICFRILAIVAELFSGVIGSATLPIFSRLSDDVARARQVFVLLTRAAANLAALVYGTLIILAPILVPLLFGEKWARSAELLQILAIGTFLSSFMQFDRTIFYAFNRPHYEMAIVGLAGVITVGLAAAFVPLGLTAVCIGVAMRPALTWGLRVHFLGRAIDLDRRQYLGFIARPAFSLVASLATGEAAVLALEGYASYWARLCIAWVLFVAATSTFFVRREKDLLDMGLRQLRTIKAV